LHRLVADTGEIDKLNKIKLQFCSLTVSLSISFKSHSFHICFISFFIFVINSETTRQWNCVFQGWSRVWQTIPIIKSEIGRSRTNFTEKIKKFFCEIIWRSNWE